MAKQARERVTRQRKACWCQHDFEVFSYSLSIKSFGKTNEISRKKAVFCDVI